MVCQDYSTLLTLIVTLIFVLFQRMRTHALILGFQLRNTAVSDFFFYFSQNAVI